MFPSAQHDATVSSWVQRRIFSASQANVILRRSRRILNKKNRVILSATKDLKHITNQRHSEAQPKNLNPQNRVILSATKDLRCFALLNTIHHIVPLFKRGGTACSGRFYILYFSILVPLFAPVRGKVTIVTKGLKISIGQRDFNNPLFFYWKRIPNTYKNIDNSLFTSY